jgi:hypothetical protein
LQHWGEKLAKIGLESGSMTPWLARELAKVGFPVVWCAEYCGRLAFDCRRG